MNNAPTHRPYRVDATQKEKLAILKNDQRVRSGSTFLDHTHSEEGGRFAKPTNVIGSTPTPQYPMAAPNWSVDPTGVEPPLGYDINEVAIVGEPHEIRASLDDTAATNVADVASPCGEVVVSSSELAGEADASSVEPLRTGEAPTSSSVSFEPPAILNPKRRSP
jgi:hypothetical protein